MAFSLNYALSVGLQLDKTGTASESKINYLHQRLAQTLDNGLSQSINFILQGQSSWTLDFNYLAYPKGLLIKASGPISINLNGTSELNLVEFFLTTFNQAQNDESPLISLEATHPGLVDSADIQVEVTVFGSVT